MTNEVIFREVVVHPMYDNIFLRHDISIGKLSHPLHFNKYTQPICIPSSTDMTPDPGYLFGVGVGGVF